MFDSFTLAPRWLKPLDEDYFWTFVAEQKAGRLVFSNLGLGQSFSLARRPTQTPDNQSTNQITCACFLFGACAACLSTEFVMSHHWFFAACMHMSKRVTE